MSEEEKGFVIKDKRAFSQETGQSRPEGEREPQEDRKKDEEIGQRPEPEREARPEEEMQLPEVNFATFIFSLNSSALYHLGELPDPQSGTKEKNLPIAKHTIDILGMLEEKTKGNLSDDEAQLLKNILYDLRMRYVKARS